LARLFNDGLYFSGDTAQAIQKGVSFKFSDILDMFREDFKGFKLPFDKPSRHELTFNFRSHNNILQLANSIVQMIEEMFPKAIDSLKKEASHKNGPKPIFMPQICMDTLKQLLLDENATGMSPEQVILVRDEAAKQSLP
jgi:ATP-dependent exoDNAse (exonuclease V) beta subunit